MRKTLFQPNRAIWAIIVLLIILLVIVLFVKCPDATTTDVLSKLALGGIAVFATFYIGSLQVQIEDDRIFKDLFEKFNSRYDHELNDLINALRLEEQEKLHPDRELCNLEKLKLLDYFNLCAEEFLWFKRNRIPSEVWEAWRAGILWNLQVKIIRKFYDEEVCQKDAGYSYYGLIEELETHLPKR